MITTKKVFGSYVLTKVDFDKLASAGTKVDGESPCCIGSEWTALPLLAIVPYNHDTSIFRFRLPEGQSNLKLPIGGFLLVLAPGCEHDGADAIRPYTSVQDDDMQIHSALTSNCIQANPDHNEHSSTDDITILHNTSDCTGTFELLCKRYDQWGIKESVQTHFLFTKTNHSYRPAGAVSNYIHKLRVGDCVKFKHTAICQGKINCPFTGVSSLTMIAVGVGVAPMIQTLRGIFKTLDYHNIGSNNSESAGVEDGEVGPARCSVERVVLLYGVRTVADILLREQLEAWQEHYGPDVFKVVYCVGSRWANVHWGAKTLNKGAQQQYVPPPVPKGYDTLRHAEQGWVNEEVVLKHAFPPAQDTRVLVCGLPGVYDKLCGSRESTELTPHSVLQKLQYTSDMVIKL